VNSLPDEVERPKLFQHAVLLTEHVFDKLRSVDLGLGEFEVLLEGGVVIEETVLAPDLLKELVLLIEWVRPLHVVVIVDDGREEERILTVYEPDPTRWLPGFRRRR
jgi:hypothetical protein